jgi:hypothetical protein
MHFLDIRRKLILINELNEIEVAHQAAEVDVGSHQKVDCGGLGNRPSAVEVTDLAIIIGIPLPQ